MVVDVSRRVSVITCREDGGTVGSLVSLGLPSISELRLRCNSKAGSESLMWSRSDKS